MWKSTKCENTKFKKKSIICKVWNTTEKTLLCNVEYDSLLISDRDDGDDDGVKNVYK